MATAKIATLLVRTLAKPIATQLRTQAAQHESFRKVCVGIAQRLHRVEMGLRWGLVPKAPAREASHSRPHSHTDEQGQGDGADGGEKGEGHPSSFSSGSRPKVRPLNEAKAIANGATFLSEAFLFLIAAALILGESWRSSAKNRQQRDRTEERVEEVARAVMLLGRKLGVDTGLKGEDEGSVNGGSGDVEERTQEETQRQSVREAQEEEAVRLRRAVDVLLRMAINGGLIQGQEALNLNDVMQGKDSMVQTSDGRTTEGPITNDQTAATPITAATSPSPILQQLASHRARQLAEMSRIQAS